LKLKEEEAPPEIEEELDSIGNNGCASERIGPVNPDHIHRYAHEQIKGGPYRPEDKVGWIERWLDQCGIPAIETGDGQIAGYTAYQERYSQTYYQTDDIG